MQGFSDLGFRFEDLGFRVYVQGFQGSQLKEVGCRAFGVLD